MFTCAGQATIPRMWKGERLLRKHWIQRQCLWSEKNPIAPFFTVGFQKPWICADSWFLESNGKKGAMGFFSDHRHFMFVCKGLHGSSAAISIVPSTYPVVTSNSSCVDLTGWLEGHRAVQRLHQFSSRSNTVHLVRAKSRANAVVWNNCWSDFIMLSSQFVCVCVNKSK